MIVDDNGLDGTEAYSSAEWAKKKAFLTDPRCTIAAKIVVLSEGYEDRIKFYLVKEDGTKSGIVGTTPFEFRDRSVANFERDLYALADTTE